MTGEIYYREKYPKELRIQIANEDEFKVLRLIFNDSFGGMLRRFKSGDLEVLDLTETWKKDVLKKSMTAESYGSYDNYGVYEALAEESYNMKVLEDASNV